MIRCILVDDEPLARTRLRSLLAESDAGVEVVAEADSGESALRLVSQHHPDVVFLDVSMPGLDGFDVAELMPEPRPFIVFVTAYDHHALRAFDVHAVDYLTKPVRAARLQRTLHHVAEIVAARSATVAVGAAGTVGAIDSATATGEATAARRLTRIAVHQGRRLRVVPVESVRWLEARDRVVYARLDDGEYPVDHTLDDLEARLDPQSFLRVHRSYLVNAREVRELAPWFAGSAVVKLADGTQLPVARRRVRAVKELLGAG